MSRLYKRICIIKLSSLTPFLSAVTNLIPRHCLFCLQQTNSSLDLCQHCIADLALNECCCQKCASPLEPASLEQTTVQNIRLCGDCLSHKVHYDRVFSPFLYSEEIAYLIKKLKYQRKIHYAHILATLFIEKIRTLDTFQLPQAIIPVPMHTRRLKERGFNQALEISRIFASYYQIPLNYTSFVRHRYTELQAELNASTRQKNVQHAFLLKNPIQYTHIALVDDVMTTGSTVNEAAKILKRSTIKKIDVWTIARAGLTS